MDATAAVFELKVAAGSERKKTGSYYTPASLIIFVLLLIPLSGSEWSRKPRVSPIPEQAILKLKVVDPACGSGHFLIAAAHRVAKRLAGGSYGRRGTRARKLFAMHSEMLLAIVSMGWTRTRSRWSSVRSACGWRRWSRDGLLVSSNTGFRRATVCWAQRRICWRAEFPDEAFEPIEGDTKEACAKWRKVNKQSERKAAEIGAAKFAFEDYPWLKIGNFAQSLLTLDNLADDTIERVSAPKKPCTRWRSYLATIWTASFLRMHGVRLLSGRKIACMIIRSQRRYSAVLSGQPARL